MLVLNAINERQGEVVRETPSEYLVYSEGRHEYWHKELCMQRTVWLRWFRDMGKGQQASDALLASERFDGSWPVAEVHCVNRESADALWVYLYRAFDINAMTYL